MGFYSGPKLNALQEEHIKTCKRCNLIVRFGAFPNHCEDWYEIPIHKDIGIARPAKTARVRGKARK